MSNIKVSKITFNKTRVVCIVECGGNTDKELAARVLEKLPNLKLHPCKNNRGPKFIDVIESTSIAHLFEHIVIDLESRSSNNITFGTTTRLSDNKYKVELSYTDDIAMLKSINEATKLINFLIEEIQDSSSFLQQ
ncbi:MAG: hypothetical protein Q4E88_05865 [Coriobacteriia bacterium]|nr:hypothetical protein [Coriobacteriia bacterium]